MNLKEHKWKAAHHYRQFYDEVHITTVPRWKESELSGDEWRISARIIFKYKGHVIFEATFRNAQTALEHANTYFVLANEHNLKYGGEPDRTKVPDDLCDQEGCCDKATIKRRLITRYDNSGTKREPTGIEYRQFCDQHKMRGDCGLDDADRNYEDMS